MAALEDYIRYANQGATRNKPLSPELTKALGFLPGMGITAEVFSGGQDDSGPNRTGSHRHDDGGAGDVRFYRGDKMLDWGNPDDIPTFQEIVKQGKAAGLTGFGAGDGYMSPGSMHLGFGSPAVWGAGGKGSNAPEWLRTAFGLKPDVVGEVLAAGNPAAGIQNTGMSMGAPQGASGIVSPGTIMPPLAAAPNTAVASAAPVSAGVDLGDKVGSAIFGDDLAASLKKTFGTGAAADSPGKAGLGLMAKAMGGGSAQDAVNREAATITPSAALAQDDGARMQAGATLMQALLAKKKPTQQRISMGA